MSRAAPVTTALLTAILTVNACAVPREADIVHVAQAPDREAIYQEMNAGNVGVADGIMNNLWPARGFPDAKLPSELTWTEDPYDDAYFRFMFYSLRHLEHLLFAYTRTEHEKYLKRLTKILDSFVAYDADRPFDSKKFDDRHSSGYRAMVLTNMYFKLRKFDALSLRLERGLRESIERVARFLMQEENFEFWANHGFTEAAALLVIAANFEDMPDAELWRDTAIERLDRMRTTNIDEDGVDVENSPFHHQYVLGLMSQITNWAELYEPSLGKRFRDATTSMLKYMAYVAQPDGELPLLGASQQTTIQSRDPKLFGPLSAYDEEYEWAFSRGKSGKPLAKRVKLFPVAGLFLVRSHSVGKHQTYVSFDAGAYRTDHSDLDALSVTLYSDGVTLCPDSGLFTYVFGDDYDYFHGTRAHNTVLVDGRDQLEGAAFPGAHGVAGKVAWATGMSTAYYGVKHLRTVMILDQSLVLITDDLASDKAHDYTQTWHFAPDAKLKVSGLEADLSDKAGRRILRLRQAQPDGMTADTAYGTTDRLQGWFSDLYNQKQPMHAVEYTRHGSHARFATLFAMGGRAVSAAEPKVRETSDAAATTRVIRVCAGDADLTVRLRAEGTPEAELEVVERGGC